MIFDDKKRFAAHYAKRMHLYRPQKFVFSNEGKIFSPDSVTLGRDNHGDWAIYLDSTFAEKDMKVVPFKMFFALNTYEVDENGDAWDLHFFSDEQAILYTKLFLNYILISKESEPVHDFYREAQGRRDFYREHETFAKKYGVKKNHFDLSNPEFDIFSSPDRFHEVFMSADIQVEINGAALPYGRCEYGDGQKRFYFVRDHYFNPPTKQYITTPFVLTDFYQAEKMVESQKRQDLVINFKPVYSFSNVHCSGYGVKVAPYVESQKNALYRMFDGNSQLLYIGISNQAQTRFRQHFNKQPWGKDVRDIKVEFFPDRNALEDAEKIAIKKEQPKYNKVHAM